MTWRRYEVNTVAFAIVDGAGEAANFNFTAVTRTGVYFTDGQGAKMTSDLGACLMGQLNVSRRVAVEQFGHKSGADEFRKQHGSPFLPPQFAQHGLRSGQLVLEDEPRSLK